MFADRVNAETLPPAARRIPEQPLVVRTFAGDDGPGRQGGQLTMLVSGTRDTVLMTIYSYARLIVYDGTFKLKLDILENYESNEGREFTFTLRAGHKWSDGHPFTTEDFRFFWEDIANNADLSPSGPPDELLADGKPPKVDIIDKRTIKYSWDTPNPYFIESQARAAPLFLFAPAHHLKKFHPRYSKCCRGRRRGQGQPAQPETGCTCSAGASISMFRQRQRRYALAQPLGADHAATRAAVHLRGAIPTITALTRRASSYPMLIASSSP